MYGDIAIRNAQVSAHFAHLLLMKAMIEGFLGQPVMFVRAVSRTDLSFRLPQSLRDWAFRLPQSLRDWA